jgi:exopolysaccharide biosynthesis polyprenyl glycosylphosphotransferase
MHEKRRRVLLNCLRCADLVVMAAAFAVALLFSGKVVEGSPLDEFLTVRVKLLNLAFFAGFAVLWNVIFGAFGLYRSRRVGLMTDEWWDVAKAVGVGTLILSGFGLVFNFSAVNRAFVAGFFITALLGTALLRTALRSILGGARRRGRNLRNLVIIGCGPRGAEFGREVRSRPELGYLLLGYIDEIAPPLNPLHGKPEKLLGSLEHSREVLAGIEVDEVVISLPIRSYYETITRLIVLCEELGLVVRIPADFFESRLVHAYVDKLHDTPVLTLQAHAPAGGSTALKRVIDFFGSVAAMIAFSPLFAFLAAAIKLDSSGPVFFVQERVGLGRRKFRLIKFRTMQVDAEERQAEIEGLNEVDGAAFKIKNDPRVTRVGRILRKTSLDEIPQMWNVFRGDMSLVGPRPLPVRDVSRFDGEWQQRRFTVRPGLTCLWQINGRHNIDFDHWMELDLQYIDNWSLSLDFDIMFKTIPAVLRGTGAS